MPNFLRLTSLLLTASLACLAQAETAPASSAKPAPPSQEQVLDIILKDEPPAPTPSIADAKIKPKAPPAPALNLAALLHAPEASLGPLATEGALVSQARAQLVRVDGERKVPVITFHSENSKNPRRPMLVLPNRKLEELEGLLAKSPDAPIIVSGVVEVYRGNNYLRLTRAVLRKGDGNVE